MKSRNINRNFRKKIQRIDTEEKKKKKKKRKKKKKKKIK